MDSTSRRISANVGLQIGDYFGEDRVMQELHTFRLDCGACTFSSVPTTLECNSVGEEAAGLD
jgi:hypothetical protein